MSALSQFFAEIDAAIKALDFDEGEEAFYRGHSDHTHLLEPSLQREQRQAGMSTEDLRYQEAAEFFEFRARARELHASQLSDWDWLFAMRHHGVPSRLLDWSDTLGFSLFFALEKWTVESTKTPCVWVLNPYTLNAENWGVRDLVLPRFLTYRWDGEDIDDSWDLEDYYTTFAKFPFDRPVAVYPPQQRSARQHAQRGWFTVHGNKSKPLEQLNPDCVRRVDISAEVATEAQAMLKRFGLDSYVIYADLDGLTDTLNRKYFPKPPAGSEAKAKGAKAKGTKATVRPASHKKKGKAT